MSLYRTWENVGHMLTAPKPYLDKNKHDNSATAVRLQS